MQPVQRHGHCINDIIMHLGFRSRRIVCKGGAMLVREVHSGGAAKPRQGHGGAKSRERVNTVRVYGLAAHSWVPLFQTANG